MVGAQFYAGYGAAYFPNGLRPVYAAVSMFNHSSDLDKSLGPIATEGHLLPAHLGFSLGWRSHKGELMQATRLTAAWQHTQATARSSRKNSDGNLYHHRIRSQFHSLLFGVESTRTGFFAGIMESWTLKAYTGNYNLRYSIGAGDAYAKGWNQKRNSLDFGLDLGMYLHTKGAVRLYLHYTRSMLRHPLADNGAAIPLSYVPGRFTPNLSHLGALVQIPLNRCFCNTEE
jgi:hypothetical protein